MNSNNYRTDVERRYSHNNNSAAVPTMAEIQRDANTFAATNRRAETNAMYRPGKRQGTTPEQAFAAALEANPEAYTTYRQQHNAADLVARLNAAGVKLAKVA